MTYRSTFLGLALAVMAAGPAPANAQTATAPVISAQPQDQIWHLRASSVIFTIEAAGFPEPTFQWQTRAPESETWSDVVDSSSTFGYFGAHAQQLTITNAGSPYVPHGTQFRCIVANSAGTATSEPATLREEAYVSISQQPADQTVAAGSSVTFTVAVEGAPSSPEYHWFRWPAGANDWVMLSESETYVGVNTATLTVATTTLEMNGDQFRVQVFPPVPYRGGGTSLAARLTVTSVSEPSGPSDPPGGQTGGASQGSKLVNFSTRAVVGSGDDVLIVGFSINGGGPRQVLVRGIGPTLGTFGVPDALPAVELELLDSAGSLASAGDWQSSPEAAAIAAAAEAAGAFPLPDGSHDSALLVSLDPGLYTAQVRGVGAGGAALVEVYDLGEGIPNPTGKMNNISTRGHVDGGSELLIAGFVVDGPAPQSVLIRGIGPTLATYGVSAALANPRLTVFRSQDRVAENDDWDATGDAQLVADASAVVGAFSLPAGSKDAALVLSLDPGAYTVQVAGADGGAGVALVEIYAIPEPASGTSGE